MDQQLDFNFKGKPLVEGHGFGQVLFSETALSFFGGVEPATGKIVDTHHPLRGEVLSGKILAIPSGRGSCGASGVLFEMLLSGLAPAGIIFAHDETILTFGVIIAEELFHKSIPLVILEQEEFDKLREAQYVEIDGANVATRRSIKVTSDVPSSPPELDAGRFSLSARDKEFLSGERGPAARAAMRIILRALDQEGTRELVDVTQAHIDGCYYTGPGSLAFAEKLRDLGGKVTIPSTMNAISVDRRQWEALGVDPNFGIPSGALADAYEQMGVRATYTCAPYVLETAPTFGEQIVWAESNAVIFANSVIGARTLKYPDYLDICIALTGRAPKAGCHVSEQRLATLVVEIPALEDFDDSFYPLLGYLLGNVAVNDIPVVTGLEKANPTRDNLKAMCAAYATTSAAPMFHVVGITPEAATLADAVGVGRQAQTIKLSKAQFRSTWDELNTSESDIVDVVSFGNPHFTFTECAELADLCRGRSKHPEVEVMITCGRQVYQEAIEAGIVDELKAFGVRFLNDTCWCLITQPIVPSMKTRASMTNSAKYAHYGPATINRGIRFGNLRQCVEAACSGNAPKQKPSWLA